MKRFIIAAAAAIVGPVVANITVLVTLRPLVIDPAMPLHALTAGPVAVFTTIGALGAILVYAGLRAAMRNPDRTFVAISALVLVLSFIPDYQIIGQTTGMFAGGTWPTALTLALMHVVAAAIIVPALLLLWGPRPATAVLTPPA